MNFSVKRKNKTGRFDYCYLDTTKKPEMWRPVGFCNEHWEKGNPEGHHATPEKAVECFIEFMLERGLKYDGACIVMTPCALCHAKTMACTMFENEMFLPLCTAHCNPDGARRAIKTLVSFEVFPELAEDKENPINPDDINLEEKIDEALRSRTK